MIISTKGRYGLRAMFELALYYGPEPVSLNNIAKKQAISETYLEQIFSKLRKEGLVESVRGAQGGYLLARPPGEISVADILNPLEGPLTPADCVVNQICENSEHCAARSIWMRIYEGINGVIQAITLQDMLDDYYAASGKFGDVTRCK